MRNHPCDTGHTSGDQAGLGTRGLASRPSSYTRAMQAPPPNVTLAPNAIAFRDPLRGILGTGFDDARDDVSGERIGFRVS
ncbi:MAG: hypothetical protein QOJ47_1025 [Gaiellales bacterium]|nr:hypothetical protein [Gaiellales bacterium]